MRYSIFTLVGFFLFLCSNAQSPAFVSIETRYGAIIVKLYDETPAHRDNFLKLVKDHYFDTTLFHRVVPNFVIQGGDPDSLFTTPSDTTILKQQRLMPEYNEALFHKRGALGAGRDDNPLEASLFSQFYIVQGRRWTDAELDALEKRIGKGFTVSPAKRAVYTTLGGQPRLDGDYTIFGEVVQGMDVVDKIAGVTAYKELPVEPVRLKLKVLKRHDVKRLTRKLRKEQQ
ncbi:MAG: peptidylprolyl isomerase [Flaviaesturariibacter sp.]|nr:peptidylprolyl isomerase [Flaviaesturariibacter sp.]